MYIRLKKNPIEDKILKFCLKLNGFNNSKNINKKPMGIIDCINQIGIPIKLSVPYSNSTFTNKKLDKAKKKVTNKVIILENKNLKLKFILVSTSIGLSKDNNLFSRVAIIAPTNAIQSVKFWTINVVAEIPLIPINLEKTIKVGKKAINNNITIAREFSKVLIKFLMVCNALFNNYSGF